jgi:hypothetical protein
MWYIHIEPYKEIKLGCITLRSQENNHIIHEFIHMKVQGREIYRQKVCCSCLGMGAGSNEEAITR